METARIVEVKRLFRGQFARGACLLALVAAMSGISPATPAMAEAPDTRVKHGTPVRAVPLARDIRLGNSSLALAIWYTSIDFAGRPTVVSGSLTLPKGKPPRGGWPVVSFGHGMGGAADVCAQSRIGQGEMEIAVLEPLLAAGYAVAISDYPGIGTPGEATLIDGPSEGRAVIDIVRAARQIAPVSRNWVALGYSLGGHAVLFAGSMADEYAPSLNHLGTIAMAGLSQLRMLAGNPATYSPTAPMNALVPYLAHGIEVTHPGQVEMAKYLTVTGGELLDAASRICLGDMFAKVTGLTNADVYAYPDGLYAEFARWYEEEEIPVTEFARPVRLVHGLNDEIPAFFSQITATQLAAAGSTVEYTPVENADHITLLPTIAPSVLTWVRECFATASAD